MHTLSWNTYLMMVPICGMKIANIRQTERTAALTTNTCFRLQAHNMAEWHTTTDVCVCVCVRVCACVCVSVNKSLKMRTVQQSWALWWAFYLLMGPYLFPALFVASLMDGHCECCGGVVVLVLVTWPGWTMCHKPDSGCMRSPWDVPPGLVTWRIWIMWLKLVPVPQQHWWQPWEMVENSDAKCGFKDIKHVIRIMNTESGFLFTSKCQQPMKFGCE